MYLQMSFFLFLFYFIILCNSLLGLQCLSLGSVECSLFLECPLLVFCSFKYWIFNYLFIAVMIFKQDVVMHELAVSNCMNCTPHKDVFYMQFPCSLTSTDQNKNPHVFLCVVPVPNRPTTPLAAGALVPPPRPSSRPKLPAGKLTGINEIVMKISIHLINLCNTCC